MRVRAKSRSLLVLLLMVAVAVSGCLSTTTTSKTYRTTINSTPEGAYVWRTDGENREAQGVTPVTLEREYKVKHHEINWWRASVGLVLSSALIAGGSLMAASSTTTTTTADSGTTASESSADNVSGGASLILLGGVGLAWTLYDIAGDDEVEVNGTIIGDKAELTEQDYLAALPKQEYRITSEGYLDKEQAFRPGSSTVVQMIPDPDSPSKNAVAKSRVHKPSSTVVAAPQPTAYALVVGIEDYRNLPTTVGAKDDAQRFAKMLENTLGLPNQHIHLLTDENATRSDVLAKLDWLKKNVPEDGRIYFYFSGHGSPNVESGDSYLLPFEGKAETIAYSGVEMEHVLSTLGDSKAREVLAFVDACFSGQGDRSVLPEGTRPLVPVQALKAEPRVALFSASGAKEIAGNASGQNGGLFTYHLLNALSTGSSDINGDGRISLAEVNSFVAPRVARDAKRASRKQNPGLDVAKDLGSASDIIVVWGLPMD